MTLPSEDTLLPPVGTLLGAIAPTGRAVIVGPPGSGKTVLAVHLARRAAASRPTDVLVASEHLVQWVRQALAGVPNVRISNWRTWIAQEYTEATRTALPKDVRDAQHGFRWQALERAFSALGSTARTMVVDEAQDVPAALMRILALRSDGLLAFADPVQRFASEGSAVEDLVDAIASDDPWPVFVLEEDFRTTRAIQAFATAAWVPERERVARPARRDGPLPIVRPGGPSIVVDEVRRWRDDPAVATLVVATAQTERASILSALSTAGIEVARRPHVDDASVRVLAFEALRGLEFDAVVLAPPENAHDDTSTRRANLYVAATRARHGLSLVAPEPLPVDLGDELARAGDRYVGASA